MMVLQQQQKSSSLDWLRPGKKEVGVVGNYVRDQGPKLHQGFGGSSELDVEHVKFVNLLPQPYQQLEHVLRQYITETLCIQLTTFDNGLSDKIGEMETAYKKTKEGFWHRLWYRMGNNQEIVSAWLDLIPSEYGLFVIKAGIAVVFKLAENSSDKGQKVFSTFSTLQRALVNLQPERARFRADPRVCAAVTELHGGIVKAIDDMVQTLIIMERSRWTKYAARLKNNIPEEAPPTPDTILETLENHIQQYNDEIDLARDRLHEETGAYGRFTATKAVVIHNDLNRHASRVEAIGGQLTGDVSRVDGKANIMISSMRRMAVEDAAYREEQRLQDERNTAMVLEAFRGGAKELRQLIVQDIVQEMQQAENRTLVMNSIIESQKQRAINDELAALRQEVSHGTRHTAVVTLAQLCTILAQPVSANNPDDPPDLERFLHPTADLRHALAEQSKLPRINQGQAQSLLTHPQFLDWMSHSHPSLLLVDANIHESSRNRLSALSVFCSTLVTSLAQLYPDAVIVHFFCGMHSAPSKTWYGPKGLVRSLLMQLLSALDTKDPDMRDWNLDFISDRGFLQNLEQHCIDDLCFALHSLLYEFPAGTHVYVIVDSIDSFDVRRLLKDLGVVMERLREIVDDPGLVPVVKVLLTNPGTSTPAVRGMRLFQENSARYVSLSRQHLVPGEISGRVMEGHLLRAPSPMGRRTPSPFRHSRAPSPAVSVRKRIAAPVAVVREVFVDRGEDRYDEGYWDGDDGRWNN